jgi:hypothetical protein
MSRAEEDDEHDKDDDNSSEGDILAYGIETITKDDIKLLMSGITTMIGDFKSMKEKQKQFEEILLGTTVPEKTPAKEVKSKGKGDSKVKSSSKSKKTQDSSDSSNNDNDSSSSSSSSSSSEDVSDPDLDPDDLFARAFGDKSGKANKFQFVNPMRGSSTPIKHSKSEKNSRKSLMFSKDTYSTVQEPHYTRMQPSFDHIKLEKLNAPSVIRFLQNLNEYQQKHRITLKAGTLIDRRIINDLMADNNIYDWDYGQFYELDTVTISTVATEGNEAGFKGGI